jgi:ATP-binding cassette, subfamily C, bacterial CydD
LKLYGRARIESQAIESASEELRGRTLKVLRIAFLSSAVLEFFAALGVAGVALYIGLTYLGFISLRSSAMTLQAGLFCLLMAPEIYQPLRLLAAYYHDRAAAKAALAEISAQFGGLGAIEAEPNLQRPNTVGIRERNAISVELCGLTLHAPKSDAELIGRASLTVPHGRHVAIMGQSGIGKTTLLEAICGLRTYRGEIWLGGARLDELDDGWLRRNVAFLGQRPWLLQGTIAENIRFGLNGASDDKVRAAAALACVCDFADKLPQQLETVLGEGGLGLSGGEKQRVALARICLRDPALILLDEPTSHLDEETEARVLSNILRFSFGRTLIVATHSAFVADQMDRCFQISDGHLLPMQARTISRSASRQELVA